MGAFDSPNLGRCLLVETDVSFLEAWFTAQSNGDWEHDTGIRIETLDNPGWRLRVNLVGTPLHGAARDWTREEESEREWLFWKSDGLEFDAACGPGDLHRAMGAFRTFVEGTLGRSQLAESHASPEDDTHPRKDGGTHRDR